MMRPRSVCLFVLAGLVLPGLVHAGPYAVRFGVQGYWSDDVRFGGGARVSLLGEGPAHDLEFVASFDTHLPEVSEYQEASFGIVYVRNRDRPRRYHPYFGGGLRIALKQIQPYPTRPSRTSRTAGVNLVGGLRFRTPIFIESRLEIIHYQRVVFSAGILF